MSKTFTRQRGQGMVEYTVVTSLGILVLLGPGVDVIRWTMDTIKNNYQGYSYAMSLSQWPEFNLASTADPIVFSLPAEQPASMSHTGTRGGVLPTFTPPEANFDDFSQLAYRAWIVDQESEERAEHLAGPNMDEEVERLVTVFESALNLASFVDFNAAPTLPDSGDFVDLMPTTSEMVDIIGDMMLEHFSPF